MNRLNAWVAELRKLDPKHLIEDLLEASRRREQQLANEVVSLHARLRAYEDVAGTYARADILEDMLEEAIDTLQWLAAGQEVVYAHDVDVVARGLAAELEELKSGT